MCVLCICNVKIDIKKGNIKPKKYTNFLKRYYVTTFLSFETNVLDHKTME